MGDMKRTLRYLRKALKKNDEQLLGIYSTAELEYLKKQLAVLENAKKDELNRRRTQKGFSNDA